MCYVSSRSLITPCCPKGTYLLREKFSKSVEEDFRRKHNLPARNSQRLEIQRSKYNENIYRRLHVSCTHSDSCSRLIAYKSNVQCRKVLSSLSSSKIRNRNFANSVMHYVMRVLSNKMKENFNIKFVGEKVCLVPYRFKISKQNPLPNIGLEIGENS